MKHSKLKIIGSIGFAVCVISGGIISFFDKEIGLTIAIFSITFAILIPVGLLNER